MRMVVVLPAPLGPMNPYTSPRSSLSDSRFRAYRSPYIFVRSRVSIILVSGQWSVVSGRWLRCNGQRTTDNGQLSLRGFDGDEHAHVGPLGDRAGQLRALLARVGQLAEPQPTRRHGVVGDLLGGALPGLRVDAPEQDRLVGTLH